MLDSYKFTFAFIVWMVLITFLSLFSFEGYEGMDIEIPLIDKLVHFIFYFIATILGCFFIRERTKGVLSKWITTILIGAAMILYGLVIEIIQQMYTANRSGEILDFLANLTGVLIALFIVNYLFSPKSGLKWKV